MDTVINTHGNRFLELCQSSNICWINGRVGDDAGVGSYTNLSPNGNHLIYYARTSCSLYSSRFILYFDTLSYWNGYKNSCSCNKSCFYYKSVWDEKIQPDWSDILSELCYIDNIVSNIVSKEIGLNDGVFQISNIMYDKAFNIFDKKCSITKKTWI
jgi:hypothetical protein